MGTAARRQLLLSPEDDDRARGHQAGPAAVKGLPPPVGGRGVKNRLPPFGPLLGQRPPDGLVVGVEQQQEGIVCHPLATTVAVRDRLAVEEEADREGMPGVPVVIAHFGPVGLAPAQLDRAADGTALDVAPPPEHGMLPPQRDEVAGEAKQVLVDPSPVMPGDLVVLAVGVVVATLAAPGFVPAEEHGGPLGEQQGRQEVALLFPPQPEDGLVVCVALGAAIP